MVVDIGHNAARCGIVFKVKQHSVHLIHIALGVAMLHAELVAVSLADRACFVCPGVPHMGSQLVNIVAFFLPYPQKLVDSRFPEGAADRENGKLLGKVIAVYDAELFDRVRALAVVPFRADIQIGVPNAVFKYILAVCDKNFISSAHFSTS